MYEFYGQGKVSDSVFATFVRRKAIILTANDVARILWIPNEGWDYYVHKKWPPLDNLPFALKISRKYSHPNLAQDKLISYKEMSFLHKLYINVVHKVIIPRKEHWLEAIYFDLTLIELSLKMYM